MPVAREAKLGKVLGQLSPKAAAACQPVDLLGRTPEAFEEGELAAPN
jgi:hypothetical protein